MTRPMRTIVVLGAIAVAGFVGLTLLADRYRKALPAPSEASPAPASALREVDGFIAARKAMKAAMDERPQMMARLRAEIAGDPAAVKNSPPRGDFELFFAIAVAEKHALSESGLEVGSYDRVRSEYLARKAGKPPANASIAAALEARKDALAAADFGDYAFFDSIKSD